MHLPIAVVALLLSILYCDSDGSRNAVDDRAEIVTVKWEPDEHGFHQFSTKDLRYEDHILWFCRGDSYQQPMTSVITKVKRVSGIGAGALGVIFCFQDHENFYDFMIATNGEYGVWKRKNGNWFRWRIPESRHYGEQSTAKIPID